MQRGKNAGMQRGKRASFSGREFWRRGSAVSLIACTLAEPSLGTSDVARHHDRLARWQRFLQSRRGRSGREQASHPPYERQRLALLLHEGHRRENHNVVKIAADRCQAFYRVDVRGDVHTNSAEGYFSIFKRGMRGIYQHCAEKHLHRYLAEYDFRYNHRIALGFDDGARATLALKVLRASASRIVSLIAPTFRFEAKRFLRERRKQVGEKPLLSKLL
jgi:hypothetical protein